MGRDDADPSPVPELLLGDRIESLSDEEFESALDDLHRLFATLRVMQGASQLVGKSKTLHFLLPHLVMPIDRKYTLTLFYGMNVYYHNAESEWELFEEISRACRIFATHINRYDVANEQEPIPKIIDKAIISFKGFGTFSVSDLLSGSDPPLGVQKR